VNDTGTTTAATVATMDDSNTDGMTKQRTCMYVSSTGHLILITGTASELSREGSLRERMGE